MEPLKFHFFQDGQLIKKIIFAGHQQVSLSVGKTDTDIVYNVADVSRMHAQIVYDGNRVYMQDCNSTNGTYINGVKISSGQLIEIKAEDEISFSQSKSATLIVGEKVSERILQNKKSSNAEEGVKSLLQYLSGKDEIKICRAPECRTSFAARGPASGACRRRRAPAARARDAYRRRSALGFFAAGFFTPDFAAIGFAPGLPPTNFAACWFLAARATGLGCSTQ